MRKLIPLLLLLVLIAATGCLDYKPLPVEKQAFVGIWESNDGIQYLEIRSNGSADYDSDDGTSSVHISGAPVTITDDQIKIEFLISKQFMITKAPAPNESGVMEMVLDETIFTKTN